MDWEKAARDRGWADTGPALKFVIPLFRESSIRGGSVVLPKASKSSASCARSSVMEQKPNPRSEECLVTNIGKRIR